MKKLIALALAAVMLVGGAMTTMAAVVTEDTTFTDKVADGTAGWNSTGTGVTFPITEDGVTVVFENDAFTDNVDHGNGDLFGGNAEGCDNWDNFVFEILASNSAKGITLRSDAYGWTFGDAAHTPSYVATYSWDWNDFKALTDNTTVTLNAKIASDTTVEFYITFASNADAWEKYVVTYPEGVPSDLQFQIGADGGIVTLKSVEFTQPEPVTPPAPVVPETGDLATTSIIVLLAGLALVAFAAKKRFA